MGVAQALAMAGVGREIVTAWVLTFPVCGALAWLASKAFSLLF